MKRNVWENNQRHYCRVCNAWMGSDRQSILTHENGKKHRENAEASLNKQREEKLKEEKTKNLIASTLQKMTVAAAIPDGVITSSTAASFQPITMNLNTSKNKTDKFNNSDKKGKKPKGDHNTRIKKEEITPSDEGKFSIQEEQSKESNKKNEIINRKRKLMHEEGYYTLGDQTFLCGHLFYEILEKDMVVEIFTGSSTMNAHYQQSMEALPMWKTGVIIATHGNQTRNTQNIHEDPHRFSFDVSYLNDLNDEDETVEKRVDPARLRVRLGIDDLAPKTLEEAELALLGGEEIVTYADSSKYDIDENTGLSKWGTVSLRKVTTSHEVKEELKRQKNQKKEEWDHKVHQSKELERRRTEETQQMHAQDSALGAYDVFNTMKGYKGVAIHDEVSRELPVQQILHTGPISVLFKTKTSVQSQNKKRLRQTKADDSDEE